MNVLDEVTCGPFTYKVKKVEHLEDMGETFLDELLIKLKKNLKGAAMEETFLHEIIHVVNHVYCCGVLGEAEVRQMSIGLYQVLQDNELF